MSNIVNRLKEEVLNFKYVLELNQYIFKISPKRYWKNIFLNLLSSITENISLIALFPLIALVSKNNHSTNVEIPTGIFAKYWGPIITIDLWVVLVIFLGLVFVNGLLSRYKALNVSVFFYDTLNKLRMDVFRSIAKTRWAVFSKFRSADLDHVLTGDIERVQGAATSIFTIIQNLVYLFIYFAMSLLISVKMTIFAVFAGVVLFIIQHPIRKHSIVFGNKVTAERKMQYRTINEFLSGLKVIKAYNSEEKYTNQLEGTLTRMRNDSMRFVNFNAIGFIISQTLIAVIVCGYIYLSYAVFKLDFSLITLQMIVFIRLLPKFVELQIQFQTVLMNLPAYHAMRKVIEVCESSYDNDAIVDDKHNIIMRHDLALQRINFYYEDTQILKNVSFRIGVRKITAIAGPSGSGKSTIADLIMGLQIPESGNIFIDGRPLNNEDKRLWRQRIAYVPQDTYLFPDSVAENLRIAAPNASDEEINDALTKANAKAFIDTLPNGLNTIVGDGNTMFSGGERQRIAIARALLRKPEVIILDEATSALDSENTKYIMSTIKDISREVTVVIITHSSEVIAYADKIVNIDGGVVTTRYEDD